MLSRKAGVLLALALAQSALSFCHAVIVVEMLRGLVEHEVVVVSVPMPPVSTGVFSAESIPVANKSYQPQVQRKPVFLTKPKTRERMVTEDCGTRNAGAIG